MDQVPYRRAMPRHGEIERGLVANGCEAGTVQQVALGRLAFAIPFVFARETEDRIRGSFRTTVFGDEAPSDRGFHVVVDRRGMLAAQTESFEEALPDRGDGNTEFA